MKTFKKGGIHPKANKLTDHSPIQDLPSPQEVRLFLSQCIGAPAKPIVKPGDHVCQGQMVAEAGGFVSAPIHSPVCGTVKKIEPVRDGQGLWKDAIIIASDESQECETPEPRTKEEVDALTPKEIVEIIGNAGIVGLGGATFPTRVKLSPPEGKIPEFILINGAECEPFLTCDDLLMQTSPEAIAEGARLLMRSVNVDKCIIGIEENKPEAIKAMTKAAESIPGMSVVVLKKKYPQGGEKQLIQALTGREVPDGGLPVDVGAIVDNVATAYAVYDAIWNRRPLTERIVTVTGPDVENPGNFRVKFGSNVQSLLEKAGGIPAGTSCLIAGGPMMGRAMMITDTPTSKGMSGLLMLPQSMARHPREWNNCIRCGSCIDVCPMGLEPYLLMSLAERAMWLEMKERHNLSCIECGSCEYTCPSKRPLLDFIKLGKSELRKLK